MDNKVKFYTILTIAIAVGGTFTAVVYSRGEAVIYFWHCTAAIRVCILTNAILFFILTAVAMVGVLYLPEFIQRFRRNKEQVFRLEPVADVSEELVAIRVFNNNKMDFTDRAAELVGYGSMSENGAFFNHIDVLPPEKRELDWNEKDNKIVSGGHGLIKIMAIEWDGIHFYNKGGTLTLTHMADKITLRVGIEIRGKLNGEFVTKRCCITFLTRKQVFGNRVIWMIDPPDLGINDCEWEESLIIKGYAIKEVY